MIPLTGTPQDKAETLYKAFMYAFINLDEVKLTKAFYQKNEPAVVPLIEAAFSASNYTLD